MDAATLAIWRDIASILLLVEGILFSLPFLFLFVVGLRQIRRVQEVLRLALSAAREKAASVERGTHALSSALVRPILEVMGATAFLLRVVRVLVRR